MTQLLHKKPIRAVWILMFLVMFCCFSGTLTTWFVAKRTAQTALAKKLDELKARGIPIDDQSMAEYHASLTSDENASELASLIDFISSPTFKADCSGLPIVSDKGPVIPPMGAAWQEQPAVEQLLTKHQQSISRLIEIFQENGPIRFPIQFNATKTLLPHTNLRTVKQVLALEAQIAARKGDAQREYRAINALIGCSLALRGEPTLVSQVSSLSAGLEARIHLKSAVQANRLLPKHYERMRQRISLLSDIGHPFRVGLTGELGLTTQAITDPQTLRDQAGTWAALAAHSGIADRAAYRYADYLERLIKVDTHNLRLFLNEVYSLEADSEPTFAFATQLTELYTPNADAFAEILVRHKMANDLAILSLATRQFENEYKRLPHSLSELSAVGIQIDRFRALDGSIPNFQVLKNSEDNQFKIRAVIWSFNSDNTRVMSPIMPGLSDAEDDGTFWWHWDLR